ncbi:hypothetical protein [Hydrogenophaga pseudoflava]|uniref:hypothetical protein n=1 Tax=Hydrogenophaga pseudoflava TaxID=47421 RepID=UPI00082713F2|nr:hypothetical protein [Hydrogenophaga pseudoflava]
MSTENALQRANSVAVEARNHPNIDELRSTLALVDNISQDAFKRIKALCAVTLLAMEQRDHPLDMEHVAQVLTQIEQASDEAEGIINHTAENHGCQYEDERWVRRVNARRAWRDQDGRGAL